MLISCRCGLRKKPTARRFWKATAKWTAIWSIFSVSPLRQPGDFGGRSVRWHRAVPGPLWRGVAQRHARGRRLFQPLDGRRGRRACAGGSPEVPKATILDVVNRDLGAAPALYRDTLGVGIQTISAAELDDAYRSADRAEAVQWAQAWAAGAARIVEPSRAEIQKSGAMYVGMSGLMLRHHAQGIAIDCLRLFYGGQMAAYPCLGFFQLNNDGLVGACEADLQSASTMLLLTYLVGRPGYISDPVIDTSKNQIIYAHCVAPNKVFGPGGAANPYHIRSHSEDRKGAAVRSLLPLGEMTTTLKLVPEEKTLVMHQARTVANIDDDRACRTKLAAEPKDARKLAADWRWGWHRVTVYGEYRVPVQTAGSLLGFRVVEEG